MGKAPFSAAAILLFGTISGFSIVVVGDADEQYKVQICGILRQNQNSFSVLDVPRAQQPINWHRLQACTIESYRSYDFQNCKILDIGQGDKIGN